jgi:hypothetical protein
MEMIIEEIEPVKKSNCLCIYEGCDKRSSFNFKEKTTAEYCFTHKLENMVNVKSKDAFMKIAINDLILIFLVKQSLNIVLLIN